MVSSKGVACGAEGWGQGQFWLLDLSPAGQASCHQVSEQPCRTLLQPGPTAGTGPVHSPVFGAVSALSLSQALFLALSSGVFVGLAGFAELGEGLWGWRGQLQGHWGFAGMGVGRDERGLWGAWPAQEGSVDCSHGFMFSLLSSSWGFTVFYENEKHEKQQW